MATPPKSQLLVQLNRLKDTGFADMLTQFAEANNLPISFFFAIASRETNCKNILGDPRRDGMHGVGIVQIDIQHPIAKSARDTGTWKTTPAPLIEFGAKMLAADIVQVKHILPALGVNDVLKVTASGYNGGIGAAIRAAGTAKGDSDSVTTGKDYGKDVIARMLVFDDLVAGNV